MPSGLTILGYTGTTLCFMVGVQLLRSPASALRGNRVAAVGMLLILGITFGLIAGTGNWPLIIPPLVIGGALGVGSARIVRMTAMPQMVALFNGMGGGSAALIAAQDFRTAVSAGTATPDLTWAIMLSCLIGSLSFAGSLIAFAKLQELLPGRPLTYPFQKQLNATLLLVIVVIGLVLIVATQSLPLFLVFLLLALALGALFVIPIGGADMPV